MSKYEVFIGCFKPADDQTILLEDTDERYDMEEKTGFRYVRVNEVTYAFWSICEADSYGFQLALAPQEHPIVVAYWYNGGAGVREVVEKAIKDFLSKE